MKRREQPGRGGEGAETGVQRVEGRSREPPETTDGAGEGMGVSGSDRDCSS